MAEVNIGDKNKIIYNSRRIYIDKPELYLLHKYEDKLKNAKMLDIGIGFGRTTHYFASLAKEYTGVDYQQAPVDFCKQKFGYLKNSTFHVCDARNMNIFKDNYFDIVLFSFNGIDYVSHSDRILVLKEMKRVCDSDGIIYFSTHNIQCLNDFINLKGEFLVKFSLKPCRLMQYLKKKLFVTTLKRKNSGINEILNNISNLEYTAIFDGSNNFKLYNYYISPYKQIEQLKKMGLKDIRLISLNSGVEIKQDDELRSLKDAWIYYFCRPEVKEESNR